MMIDGKLFVAVPWVLELPDQVRFNARAAVDTRTGEVELVQFILRGGVIDADVDPEGFESICKRINRDKFDVRARDAAGV